MVWSAIETESVNLRQGCRLCRQAYGRQVEAASSGGDAELVKRRPSPAAPLQLQTDEADGAAALTRSARRRPQERQDCVRQHGIMLRLYERMELLLINYKAAKVCDRRQIVVQEAGIPYRARDSDSRRANQFPAFTQRISAALQQRTERMRCTPKADSQQARVREAEQPSGARGKQAINAGSSDDDISIRMQLIAVAAVVFALHLKAFADA